ncbi:putative acyl-CoA dehydrogenase [Mycobacterium avium subsp. avium 2285 (R)]|nr:putative acyl-CoA dehydrogenase [Mycobacterium avium subsp. avium 2285 (R)]
MCRPSQPSSTRFGQNPAAARRWHPAATAPPSAPSATSETRGPPRRVHDGRRSVRYPCGSPPRRTGMGACPASRGSGAAA